MKKYVVAVFASLVFMFATSVVVAMDTVQPVPEIQAQGPSFEGFGDVFVEYKKVTNIPNVPVAFAIDLKNFSLDDENLSENPGVLELQQGLAGWLVDLRKGYSPSVKKNISVSWQTSQDEATRKSVMVTIVALKKTEDSGVSLHARVLVQGVMSDSEAAPVLELLKTVLEKGYSTLSLVVGGAAALAAVISVGSRIFTGSWIPFMKASLTDPLEIFARSIKNARQAEVQSNAKTVPVTFPVQQTLQSGAEALVLPKDKKVEWCDFIFVIKDKAGLNASKVFDALKGKNRFVVFIFNASVYAQVDLEAFIPFTHGLGNNVKVIVLEDREQFCQKPVVDSYGRASAVARLSGPDFFGFFEGKASFLPHFTYIEESPSQLEFKDARSIRFLDKKVMFGIETYPPGYHLNESSCKEFLSSDLPDEFNASVRDLSAHVLARFLQHNRSSLNVQVYESGWKNQLQAGGVFIFNASQAYALGVELYFDSSKHDILRAAKIIIVGTNEQVQAALGNFYSSFQGKITGIPLLYVQPQLDSCDQFLKDFDATFSKPPSGGSSPGGRPDSPSRRGGTDGEPEEDLNNLPRYFGPQSEGIDGNRPGEEAALKKIFTELFENFSGEDARRCRAGEFGKGVLCKQDPVENIDGKVYVVVKSGSYTISKNQSDVEDTLQNVTNGIVVLVHEPFPSVGPSAGPAYTHTYVKKNGKVTLEKSDDQKLVSFVVNKISTWDAA